MSQQTSLNLSINYTKQELDSTTTLDKAVKSPLPQAYTPFSLSSPRVLNTSSCTTQHSTGLLTPCRQVGLRRRSIRNAISPTCSDTTSSASPITLRFVGPIGSSRKLRKLDKHVPHEKETSRSSGKRLNLENVTEKAKQSRYEGTEESIQGKCEERNKNHTENFNNNKGQQSDIGVFKDSDTKNRSDSYSMISSGNSDKEKVMRKTKLESLDDKTQQCSVEKPCCKDLDLQSSSSNDAHNVIISESGNDECLTEKSQIENMDDNTQQFYADTPSSSNLDFQSNSNNEDKMVNSENMIECTEENLNILKQQITAKEEEIKRLKLILLYKKKHNVNELATEITRWKEGCQEALRRLHQASVLQGYQHSMIQLMEMFGIPPKAVGYDEDADDFV
ncbi:hypothetical protein B7P43_G17287 [Cryptotermes secundus]|uniref:Swi5-dependent recombination DNA repair protein 1 homolog n=1 Tax=Cryptotermes secundus TaxID=105785 RepID=A0A2J7PBC3_9NEOP|nr:swi5-dependent recombination DNA repair protein 1 homolog [Cryptotermes secundus]PNF13634.1 hypothetical protein B7P43_G17287 [Cryptotermes secundus]